jgi:hypothetical protein
MASGKLISKASWRDSVLVIESTLELKIPNVVVNVSGLKPVVDTWALRPTAGLSPTRQTTPKRSSSTTSKSSAAQFQEIDEFFRSSAHRKRGVRPRSRPASLNPSCRAPRLGLNPESPARDSSSA